MDQTVLIVTDGQGAKIAGLTINNNQLVVSDGLPGPAGPTGPAGGQPQQHNFTDQDTWIINHNLGRFPVVELYTVGGVRVIGAVVNLNSNQAQATFDGPFSGYAIII
jgi:hypothetical protein